MVEIAEELIEAVNGRQILVAVSQMVFAKLTRSVTEGLQEFCNGRVLRLQTYGRARDANLGQARAESALSGDE